MDITQGEVMGLLEGEQVIIHTTDGSPVHYQTVVHTGSLDTLVHTGALDTVQLVHSYNLPPSAEKEETVVEQLLLEASSLQNDGGSLAHQETIISFKKPVFVDHLSDYYSNCQFTDTTVVCSDETRRVHSFVLGAASSLMKDIFADLATKIMDTELTILMPDTRAVELDVLLQPVYGLTNLENLSSASNPFAGNLFSVDYNRKSMGQRNEAEKEAEKAAVVAAAQGHFLEQTNSNYNYGEETVLNNNDENEYQEENLNPKTNTKRSRSKKGKSKYGYKYDGFINDSEEMDSADEDWEDQEPKPKKKNIRGRPKKIKEENVDKLNDEDDLNQIDPMVKVKEEAIERAFNELNEFFNPEANILQAVPVTFNQDDSGVFNCEAPNCIFSTMIRAAVQQHMRQTHGGCGYLEPCHSCPRCGEGWASELHFQKHLDSTECLLGQELPYVCENCGKGWFNLTSFTRHTEGRECKTVDDIGNKHKCTNCPQTFFSLRNRETHVKKAHMPAEEVQYRCSGCDSNFVTHKDFTAHRKIVHEKDGIKIKYSCRIPDCGFYTEKRDELAVHVHADHPNQIHLCETCGRNFLDEENLTKHMASHARNVKAKKGSGSNYDCPHCPREFNRKRHMELHVLFKHSQDRPFGCEQCGKKFKTRHCVNIHLRSHGIGGYSWCCEECGKTFNQISAYHVHLKVHSNVREFACEDCGMTFKLKHSLKKHQLTHKPEFGHTCDFCGKKFKRSDNLINHRRRHTGEHPYKCDKCSWTGPDSSSFIHHKKKHNEPVSNLGTISQGGSHPKPVMFQASTHHHQVLDQKPTVHMPSLQEIKPQQIVSLGSIHPEIKLIHSITKIQ